MRSAFLFTTLALLLAALPALGQEAPPRMSDLLGAPVTLDGERLGRVNDTTLTFLGAIKDLIVRTPEGMVSVPYSALRYDARERAFTGPAGVAVLPVREGRLPTEQSGGRLVRDEPTPTARVEREPLWLPEPPDAVSLQLQAMARAARIYGEANGSVSLTRNIHRLPRRSAAYDNYTAYSEAYRIDPRIYRWPPPANFGPR